MSVSMIRPAVSGHSGLSFARGAKAFGAIPAIALLLCASLLVAMEAPSKPFLEKNAFYLRSAGFRAQFAATATELGFDQRSTLLQWSARD